MLAPPSDQQQDRQVSERFAAADACLRLIDPRQMSSADQQNWDDLAAADRGGNPFAQPWLQRLSLAHCDTGKRARLAVVEDGRGQWLGVLPLALARAPRTPVRLWSVWSHPNQFNGTPLVRQDCAGRFWRGLLAGLDAEPGCAWALAFSNLPLDVAINRELLELCAGQGRRIAVDRHWGRAVLEPGAEMDLPAKQRRRIAGLERKLAREHGPLSFELVGDPARTAELSETFVALESSGWKGKAGSALASQDQTRRFFSEVAQAATARGAFEFAVLRSGGRIVAMSAQLVCGAQLHGFKSAYDEAFAVHAPGLLLLCRLTRHWLDHGRVTVDSGAKPGQEPVSKLWPGRRELADYRVALGGPLRRAVFAAQLAAEAAWHAAKRLAGKGPPADKA